MDIKDRIIKESLNLRKKSLNSLIASKRKITFQNFTENNIEYILNNSNIQIPNQFIINYDQFKINVIYFI